MKADPLTAEHKRASARGAPVRAAPAGRADYARLSRLAAGAARAPDDDGPGFAASFIRSAIVTGALKAGQAIRQDLLAGALGLSKPPVREALRKLEAERLVAFIQNRGFVVAPESLAELKEAFELRVVLEPAVLRLAAPHLAPADFERARDLLGQLARDRRYDAHYELNLAFHRTLYARANRPHFIETIERAHARCLRYVWRALDTTGRVNQVPDDGRHVMLVELLEAGDVDAACECLTVHLEEAAERLLAIYSGF